MNRTRVSLFALAASAFALAPAGAQVTTWVKITSAASLNGPALVSPANGLYYVSPYSGGIGTQANPNTLVNLNCVDFFHDVTIGQEWKANVTSLGAAAASPGSAASILSLTRYDNLSIYEQAAWLTTQFSGDGNNATEADAIQTAIWWEIAFNGGSPDPASGSAKIFEDGTTPPVKAPTGGSLTADTNVLDTQHWLDLAAYYAPRQTTSYYNQFEILTDVAAHGDAVDGTAQEFIISTTPEPGTMLLGATGLFAILGLGTASRRKSMFAFVRSFGRTA